MKQTVQLKLRCNAMSIFQARDIYDEAIQTVVTVRDFTQVFDACAQFEKSMIASKMEAMEEEGATDEGESLHFDVNA